MSRKSKIKPKFETLDRYISGAGGKLVQISFHLRAANTGGAVNQAYLGKVGEYVFTVTDHTVVELMDKQ